MHNQLTISVILRNFPFHSHPWKYIPLFVHVRLAERVVRQFVGWWTLELWDCHQCDHSLPFWFGTPGAPWPFNDVWQGQIKCIKICFVNHLWRLPMLRLFNFITHHSFLRNAFESLLLLSPRIHSTLRTRPKASHNLIAQPGQWQSNITLRG